MKTRTAFIGFRVSSLVKQKIEYFAKKHNFSVGELVTLATLIHIGAKEEAGKLLIDKETIKR